MNGITNIKINEETTDNFTVIDENDNQITGLIDSDFSKTLYNPEGDEVSSTITSSITELGNGKYKIVFTPDKLGIWMLTIIHSTYFPYGKTANYKCINYLVNDASDMVWNAEQKEYDTNNSTMGYRINHISSAFTKKIIKKAETVWSEGEKKALVEDIETIISNVKEVQSRLITEKIINKVVKNGMNKISSRMIKLSEEIRQNGLQESESSVILKRIEERIKNEVQALTEQNKKNVIKDINHMRNEIKNEIHMLKKELNRIEEIQANNLGNEAIKEKVSKLKEEIDQLSKLLIKQMDTEILEEIMSEEK